MWNRAGSSAKPYGEEIRDEGPGFDPTKVMSSAITKGAQSGIPLMRLLMDEVHFEQAGRRQLICVASLFLSLASATNGSAKSDIAADKPASQEARRKE